ncbi:hypothetical protein [Ectobacillus funiculus]|jgi:hypothetical protein|uniref:Uncharacterized protein n=1 Tax=Ectobacillus funiculus TaxID=137993 RepID=A0ABV5WB40_9BACI
MSENEQYRDTGKLTNYHYGTEKDTTTKKNNKSNTQDSNKK